MNTFILLIGLALLFIVLYRSTTEHFDNSSNIPLTDLAAYQCDYLTNEAKKIDVFMDSCNAPNRGEGQRETINDKWACVDNVNRQIFNDRERNLWCTAKDNKPFVSTMNMTVTGNSEPTNDHDINAVYDVVPFPQNMVQTDFSSLNKPNRTMSESDQVNFNGQFNQPIRPNVVATESNSVPVPASNVSIKEHFDVSIEGEVDSKHVSYSEFLAQTMGSNLATISNFNNNVNTETYAHGMLNKYELLNPPLGTGIDASINHLYAKI